MRRKPTPTVQAKLEILRRVHAEVLADNSVIREKYRILMDAEKLSNETRESRAANEALAAGALHSEVREALGIGNWNTYKARLALTEGEITRDTAVATGGWSFKRDEGAMGRYYRVMEVGNPAFEPFWVLSEPVKNPMPGQFERKLSPGRSDSGNREAIEYVETHYAKLYEAIETYENQWQTETNDDGAEPMDF